MRAVINVVLFVTLSTASIVEARMPNEYQADWIGGFPWGDRVHDIFYVSGKNTRRQNAPGDAATLIIISNAQENVTYRIDVPSKVYEEVPYKPEVIDNSRMLHASKSEKDKQSRITLVGTETIDGQLSDIYRETSLTSYRFENTYWVSKTYGVPIKIISRSENLSTNQMQDGKQEWFIKPGHQSPDLFVLPAGYKKKVSVGFASVTDEFIHTQKLIGRPKTIKTALCEDQKIHKIQYVNRHLAKTNCKNSYCSRKDTLEFDIYEFVEKPVNEGMCLIGDADYFRGKSIVPFTDNIISMGSDQRPQCATAVKNFLNKSKGLAIKGCWQLGKFGKYGTVDITEFVESNGVRSVTLSLYDGRRMVLKDWTAKAPTEADPDVWRLGDEGVFYPNDNVVLFGLRSGEEFELATVAYGGEGINYYLDRSVGDSFVEMFHEYAYTANQ